MTGQPDHLLAGLAWRTRLNWRASFPSTANDNKWLGLQSEVC
jgi:hypothetical protein